MKSDPDNEHPRIHSRRDTIIGSILALLAAITITLSSAAVQGLEQRWPDMELNIFRFTLMLVPLVIYFIWTKSGPLIPREKIIYVLMYGVLVSAEQVIFFIAVNFLALGFMAALFRLSLVTMAAIASRIIEKEPFTKERAIAITLGMIGIILMAQPEFIFSRISSTNGADELNNSTKSIFLNQSGSHIGPEKSYVLANDEIKKNVSGPTKSTSKSLFPTENLSDEAKTYIGICLTVFGAFLGVLQGICIKRKSLKDYCVWKLLFWIGVVAVVWTTSFSFSLEKVVFIPSILDLSLVFAYAILASSHSFTFILALKRTSYLIVAIIMVTQIVFNLIAQYTVLHSLFPGKHKVFEIIGAVFVMMAAVLPPVAEAKGSLTWRQAVCHLSSCNREQSMINSSGQHSMNKLSGKRGRTSKEKDIDDESAQPLQDKI